MLKQFRYIFLFCIVLSGGFMAVAQLPMPDNVCIGAAKHYNVDPNPVPGSTYTWRIDGVTQVSSTTNEIDITWNTIGTYLLVVQELSIHGCLGPLKSGQVFVHPIPIPNAGADRAINLNTTTQIGTAAVTGSTYNWSSVPVGFTSIVANPMVTPLVTTTFTVVETITATGCTAAGSVRITIISVNLPPVAVDDYDTTGVNIPIIINILRNDYDLYGKIASVNLYDGPYNGLVILNSDSTITYTPETSFTGFDSLRYFICANDIPVLCDTATVHIYIREDSTANRLIIYNVITPNSDGDNDRWIIDGIEEFLNNSVVIFNRWGDRINSYDHYDNKSVVWNGTNLKGQLVPDGTYYYILTIKGGSRRNGWIFIHRGGN